jgi:hypothetical protein
MEDTAAVERIARVTHQVNKAWCEYLGDTSQKDWTEAAHWQRQSAVAGVRAVVSGEASTPEQQHEAWLEHKRQGGWVYGPEKNETTREHPCMVDYADLPQEQRFKDVLFRTVVQAML